MSQIDQITTTPVILRSFNGRSSSGTMNVRVIGIGTRLARALASLGWCWLFAVITLLVPILHWILVPGLLLLGPLLALRAFGYDRQVCGGGGPCPVCGTAMAFGLSAHPESFDQACRVCRYSLNITPS